VKSWVKSNLPDGGARAARRSLWPGMNVRTGEDANVHAKCVHLSMFTQARWMKIVLCRPKWLETFQELITFLGGDADAAEKLRAALVNDLGDDWNEAYAIEVEAHRIQWLEDHGFYGKSKFITSHSVSLFLVSLFVCFSTSPRRFFFLDADASPLLAPQSGRPPTGGGSSATCASTASSGPR
jgi:hypothetical protein|tara:strand:+ start:1248 stop:1793 length:546 start_codon:yes stop_codon:yes gene_type:complete